MASVKVFGSPASTEVQRVLACLFEKDVEFQLIKMDSFRGSIRLPECLKLQPGGEALTYQDDTDSLVDSRAICRHVVDKFKKQGNKELMGGGALERALIEQWLETEAQKFDPPSSDLVFYLAIAPKLPQPEQVDPAAVAESQRKLEKVLKVYDQRLADNKFLTGAKFTLADLSHLPNTEQLMRIDKVKSVFMAHENVARWWSDISKKESWQSVLKIAQQPPPMA
ncbi:Glutathione S-transferase F11 [Apostasia shenzhenica]|uniref:glutathione transferase n=1 Tax=Apostasia shenzhenica TaxID=1088818 RepID=A0A2H9ZWU0_9ASPA|nr:Glutathione S-transferase F11 [Apostasia shenzhenica]